jgi:hypothetical protein
MPKGTGSESARSLSPWADRSYSPFLTAPNTPKPQFGHDSTPAPTATCAKPGHYCSTTPSPILTHDQLLTHFRPVLSNSASPPQSHAGTTRGLAPSPRGACPLSLVQSPIPHPSSFIPHPSPSSFILHPSSLIPHPSSFPPSPFPLFLSSATLCALCGETPSHFRPAQQSPRRGTTPTGALPRRRRNPGPPKDICEFIDIGCLVGTLEPVSFIGQSPLSTGRAFS